MLVKVMWSILFLEIIPDDRDGKIERKWEGKRVALAY